MAPSNPLMKTKTIDNITFTLEPVGAWEAIPLFHSLVSILGTMTPVIADATSRDKRLPLLDSIKLDKLFEALPAFLERASPEKIRSLAESMLATCQYRLPSKGGKQTQAEQLLPMFDVVMQGKILTVFKLLAWAITINFADFFVGGKLALAAKQAAASASAPASEGDSMPSETPIAEE